MSSYLPRPDRYEEATYRRCGRSGLQLPALSMGLWHNFGFQSAFENARNLIRTSFDLGITHFDLANNYGPPPGSAEQTFGKILDLDLRAHRDELIISTKAGYTMWDGPYGDWGSRKYLLSSLDQSLRRMGLDYVDIFYHHRPDPSTPLEESLTAVVDAVRMGKALYAGVSNYGPEQSARAIELFRASSVPLLINQIKFNIFQDEPRHDGLLDLLDAGGVGCIAFCPLAQGLLTDRYLTEIPADSRAASSTGFLKRNEVSDPVREIARELSTLAAARGQTLAQMALAWALGQTGVTSVLIGASRPEQIVENFDATKNLSFTNEEIAAIDRSSFAYKSRQGSKA